VTGVVPRPSAKLLVAAVAVVAIALYVALDPPWVVESIEKSNAGSAVAGSQNLSPDK
jgi:hypothetical protein